MVCAFVERHRWHAAAERADFEQQTSIAAAIEQAALCRGPDGKRHSHQRRIPGGSLAEANQRLQAAVPVLDACRSFDELHQVVEDRTADIPKIGALAVYDIAQRIGAFLRLEPTKVYLHCGTRVGARALGFHKADPLEVHELPREFRKLLAAEIEDCLCIYKDDLVRLASQIRRGKRSRQQTATRSGKT